MRKAAALAIGLAVATLAAGCTQPPDERAINPQKYDKDRADCQAEVNDYMKTRRRVDSSREDIFRGQQERYGQAALPTQMDDYSDTKASNRALGRCMEAKGWAGQPSQSWWEKITGR